LSRNVLVFHAQPDEAAELSVPEISAISVAQRVRSLCVDNGDGLRARLIFRPSGTEPKAKCYVEVSTPPCAPRTATEAWNDLCRQVDKLTEQLGQAFVQLALSLTSAR
ncbi:MAG: hypothetical protein NZM42_10250, partial [Gemmatales bacterium]|nr:hypothetical protein [Gemmatales bacterium]MDW8224050.1 hypothetical protein [Gemmatales bacterium]